MVSDHFSSGSQDRVLGRKKTGCSIFQRFPVFIIVRLWFIKTVLLLQADQGFLCATEAKIWGVCAKSLWMRQGYSTQPTMVFIAGESIFTWVVKKNSSLIFPHYCIYKCIASKRGYYSNWVLSYRIWNHIIYIFRVIDGMCWRNCMFYILSFCCAPAYRRQYHQLCLIWPVEIVDKYPVTFPAYFENIFMLSWVMMVVVGKQKQRTFKVF